MGAAAGVLSPPSTGPGSPCVAAVWPCVAAAGSAEGAWQLDPGRSSNEAPQHARFMGMIEKGGAARVFCVRAARRVPRTLIPTPFLIF